MNVPAAHFVAQHARADAHQQMKEELGLDHFEADPGTAFTDTRS